MTNILKVVETISKVAVTTYYGLLWRMVLVVKRGYRKGIHKSTCGGF